MRVHRQSFSGKARTPMHRLVMRHALSADQNDPSPQSSTSDDSVAPASPDSPQLTRSSAATTSSSRGKATQSARPTLPLRPVYSSPQAASAAVGRTVISQLPGRVMTANPWSALPGALLVIVFLLMTLIQWIHAMQYRSHYRRCVAAQREEMVRAAQKVGNSDAEWYVSRSRPPSFKLASTASPVLDVAIPRCKISLDGHKGSQDYSFADEPPFRLSEARPRGSVVVAQGDCGDVHRRQHSRPSSLSTRLSAYFPVLPSPRKAVGRPSRLRFDMLDDLTSPQSALEKSPRSPTSAVKSPFLRLHNKGSGWTSQPSPTVTSPVPEITFDLAPPYSKSYAGGQANRNAAPVLTLNTINLQHRETLRTPVASLARTPSGKMIPGSQFPGLQRHNTLMRSPIGGTMASGGARDSSFHPTSPIDI